MIALRSPKAIKTPISNRGVNLLLGYFLSSVAVIKLKKKGGVPLLYISLTADYTEMLERLQADYTDIFPNPPKKVGKRIILTSKSLEYLNLLFPNPELRADINYQITCLMPFFVHDTYNLWIELVSVKWDPIYLSLQLQLVYLTFKGFNLMKTC